MNTIQPANRSDRIFQGLVKAWENQGIKYELVQLALQIVHQKPVHTHKTNCLQRMQSAKLQTGTPHTTMTPHVYAPNHTHQQVNA